MSSEDVEDFPEVEDKDADIQMKKPKVYFWKICSGELLKDNGEKMLIQEKTGLVISVERENVFSNFADAYDLDWAGGNWGNTGEVEPQGKHAGGGTGVATPDPRSASPLVLTQLTFTETKSVSADTLVFIQ